MAKFIKIKTPTQINSIALINIDAIVTVRAITSHQHLPAHTQFCYVRMIGEDADRVLGISLSEFESIVNRLNSGESDVETVVPGEHAPEYVHQ